MARLIVFSDYLKKQDKAHILENLEYIATRERVELNDQNISKKFTTPLNETCRKYAVSDKQYDLIQKLLIESPEMKESLSYDQYEQHKNMYTASVFLADAMDHILMNKFSNHQYMQYISERPGVVKNEQKQHGLFDHSGAADYDFYHNKLERHNGNVWRHIISLRREDAITYGFENQTSWRDLVNAHIQKLAHNIGIDPDQLRWVGAFHNEGYHPHMHLMIWSADGKEGFQDQQAIEAFRKDMTKDIFSDELWLREQYKAEIRDQFENEFKSEFHTLLDEVWKKADDYMPKIAEELENLVAMLPIRKTQFYEYLTPELKAKCDSIITKIFDFPEMQEPIMNYMESIRLLGELYMSIGSIAMGEYISNTVEHLISPQKGDRKVLHNYILKIANDLKQDELVRQSMRYDETTQISHKLNDERYHVIEPELGKAILKMEVILKEDPRAAIEQGSPFFATYEEAMEAYLDVKDDPNLTKKELHLIQEHFHENSHCDDMILENHYPIHEAAKILQHVLMGLEEAKRRIDQEIHRIFHVNRMDERNMGIQKLRNKK